MAEIVIIGGGPSGAMCGEQLARAGHSVNIFDEHLAWEKPCGGGLTYKATEHFPFLLDNPHPKKLVRNVEIISAENQRAKLDLKHPIVIYSRRVLNGFLLPVVMIFVLILVNRRDLMGDQTNPKGFNWVAWILTVAVIVLTLVVAYSSIRELTGHPVS